ncbi:MAG: CDP-alcohol phosphatidyltransferase family protein [Acidimicrobiales bacterium]
MRDDAWTAPAREAPRLPSSPARPVPGPAPWRLKTAANGVTVARIAATPALVLVVLHTTPSWAALVFWAVLAFSDAVDGWLARRRGASASGAFLDPLADKFLVMGALVAMVAIGKFTWAPVALLAARELVVTTYRVVVARHGVSVPARKVAKAKTLVEFVTVALVLLPVAWSSQLTLSHVALWLAVGLAWASAWQYLVDTRAAGRRAVATGA